MATVTAPTTIADLPELDLFSPAFTTDPHGVLRAAREQHWAARSPRGVELLSYDACEKALLDERFQPGATKLIEFMGPDAAQVLIGEGRTLLGSDGPDHAALRRAVSPWFTPRRIAGLQGRTRELVDQLLAAASNESCDFMEDVARHLPGTVFCWMVGAPDEDGDQLAAWSATLLKVFKADPDDGPSITEASRELHAYVDELIATRRLDPDDNVASILLDAQRAGRITEADVHALLLEMLGASADNTIQSAGLMVWLLLTHQSEWDKVAADRSLVAQAIEECARFEPGVASTVEINLEPIVFDGLELPPGTMTWLNFQSAHRDDSAFPDPDTFDVGRRLPTHQLTFGVGRHYCIGAALARMELQAVLNAVLDRWTTPRLGEGVTITRGLSPVIEKLPVAFD